MLSLKGRSDPSLLQLLTLQHVYTFVCSNVYVLLNGIVGIDLDVAYGIASLGRPVTNAIVMRVVVICFSEGETKKASYYNQKP